MPGTEHEEGPGFCSCDLGHVAPQLCYQRRDFVSKRQLWAMGCVIPPSVLEKHLSLSWSTCTTLNNLYRRHLWQFLNISFLFSFLCFWLVPGAIFNHVFSFPISYLTDIFQTQILTLFPYQRFCYLIKLENVRVSHRTQEFLLRVKILFLPRSYQKLSEMCGYCCF